MESIAVVLGSSISGLLAANQLSYYFSKVIIIEKDEMPLLAKPRNGIPQSHHLHILLNRGLESLERQIPRFREQALSHGAVVTNAFTDWQSLFPGGWLKRIEDDMEMLCCTRPLLELVLRKNLFKKANIELIQRTEVTDIKLSDIRFPVVHTYCHLTKEKASFTGQVVVDCTGQHSKAANYLSDQGYGPVTSEIVESYLGYSSALFSEVILPEQVKASLITPKAPNNPIGAGILPVEGNKYIVTLYGFNKHYPPTDEQEFFDTLKNLRAPLIFDAVKDAQLVSPIKSYHKNKNVLNRFDKCKKWPKGFLVCGDAVSSLNPYYGQGITMAALCSEIIGQHLIRRRDPKWLRQAQIAICRAYQDPWRSSKYEDLRWPNTRAQTARWIAKPVHLYMNRLLKVAQWDGLASYAFISALNMKKSPAYLFSPKIMWQVLTGKAPTEP